MTGKELIQDGHPHLLPLVLGKPSLHIRMVIASQMFSLVHKLCCFLKDEVKLRNKAKDG